MTFTKSPYLNIWLALLVFTTGGCSRAAETGVAQQSAPTADKQAPEPTAWDKLRAVYEYDRAQPLEAKLVKSTDNVAANVQKWSLRGAKGAAVPFYLIEPQGASAAQPLPGVVIIHGLDSSINDMMPIGLLLATRGYAAIIPEIVGHGERRDPKNPLFSGDPERLRDGLIESVQDMRRTMDFMATRPEIDPRRIGMFGLSLGAILGSITTAVDSRLQTAVLVVGGANWKIMLRESQERSARANRDQREDLTDAQWTRLDAVDPQNFIGHIAPRPVLLINGKRDTIIPKEAAEALFDAAQEPKKQIWFNTGHLMDPSLVAPPAFEWMEKYVKNPAPAPASATAISFPAKSAG